MTDAATIRTVAAELAVYKNLDGSPLAEFPVGYIFSRIYHIPKWQYEIARGQSVEALSKPGRYILRAALWAAGGIVAAECFAGDRSDEERLRAMQWVTHEGHYKASRMGLCYLTPVETRAFLKQLKIAPPQENIDD